MSDVQALEIVDLEVLWEETLSCDMKYHHESAPAEWRGVTPCGIAWIVCAKDYHAAQNSGLVCRNCRNQDNTLYKSLGSHKGSNIKWTKL